MEHSIEPSESGLSKARDTVEGIIQTCKTVLSKNSDLTVYLSWGKKPSPELISEDQIKVNIGQGENWKEELKTTTAQAYAQAWFSEYRSSSYHWEELLMLGHSLRFAENITGKKPDLDPKDEIREVWPVLREEIQLSLMEDTEELSHYGFSLAYYITGELEESHDLKKFPELGMSDFIDAGDKLFKS